MSRGLAIGAVTLLLVTGCVHNRTGAHFDQADDFSAIKSFYWLSDEPAVIPPDADPGNSPLLHRYLKQGIEDILRTVPPR